MTDKTNDSPLNQLQKIILIFFGLLLSSCLLFLKVNFLPSNDLDNLARNSIKPEIALTNGTATIFEFYADWCEACREMAPSMSSLAISNKNKVDLVLLNVDNPIWVDFIDKYSVNGIPHLSFFDKKGNLIGYSIGVRNKEELEEIFYALKNNKELPELYGIGSLSNLDSTYIKLEQDLINKKASSPRSHG